MKNLMTATLLATTLVSASAQAGFVCQGVNKAKNQIVLNFEELSTKSFDNFTQVRILAYVYPFVGSEIKVEPITPEGCEDALFTGIKGGQLTTDLSNEIYIECAGDGDAGYMNVKKQKSGDYKAKFFAPNSVPALNLDDGEKMPMSCRWE